MYSVYDGLLTRNHLTALVLIGIAPPNDLQAKLFKLICGSRQLLKIGIKRLWLKLLLFLFADSHAASKFRVCSQEALLTIDIEP